MKKIAIAVAALVVLTIAASYNVWRATDEPVTSAPGPLAVGRTKLHAQFMDAEREEGAAEKQDWNSPNKLRGLTKWHQDRIAKLTGNTQAGEILAYDHAAVDRLQKRIAELEAQRKAQPPATPAQAPAAPAKPQH